MDKLRKDKRERIFGALEQLLDHHGFADLTLDEIARTAEIGKGTIYLYFKDKDSLFAELSLFRLEQLRQALAKLTEEPLPEFDRLLAKLLNLLEKMAARHRFWFNAPGELAAHVARLTPEQLAAANAGQQAVLEALAELFRKVRPMPRSAARRQAQVFFWICGAYCRQTLRTGETPMTRPQLLNYCRAALLAEGPAEEQDLHE